MTCIFYLILSLPYITGGKYSSLQVAWMGIYTILAALVLSICSNIILTIKNISAWIKKKRMNKLHKIMPDVKEEADFPVYRVTKAI